MKQHSICWVVLLSALLFTPTSSYATNFDLREYSLKAVFLERFTRFIDWPEEKTSVDALKPFVIGVIGNPQFTDLLNNIYQDQKIQGKKVIVQNLSNIEEAKNAHLLFISGNTDGSLEDILKYAKNLPVLTVSDSDGFAERGVMINFFMSKKQKIRFEINEQAIKNSELRISYKLLSVAKLVEVK